MAAGGAVPCPSQGLVLRPGDPRRDHKEAWVLVGEIPLPTQRYGSSHTEVSLGPGKVRTVA